MTETVLQVSGIARLFPTGDGQTQTVFENLHFRIQRGEFVCLIGHSGCGKTTILNTLAGLDKPDAGGVFMNGQEITGTSLDRAVIFQQHALMPWMTALDNIIFAVESRWPKKSKSEIQAHARKYLELVGLGHAADKKPSQLSGGMKQRVGIARAMAIEPKMLLMDEPFSALDALTRGVLQDEVVRLCRQTQQTVFMITHDVDEALLLADRIILMTNGPHAKIAEIVVNTLPADRTRHDIHRLPHYYRLRNHLVDFLVERSKRFAEVTAGQNYDPLHPPETRPGEVEEADALPQPA